MGQDLEGEAIAGAGGKKEEEPLPPSVGTALFSTCRRYRFRLSRTWNTNFAPLHFLLLNPSTADELNNDPTVERCERRARKGGYGGLVVTNIFAWRATDPRELSYAEDAVGELNDMCILEATRIAARTVCGWGSVGPKLLLRRRIPEIRKLLNEFPLWCLAKNKDGQPKHPLYVEYSDSYFQWKEPYGE